MTDQPTSLPDRRDSAEHRVDITDSFHDPRPYAECTCGWRGPRRSTAYFAQQDAKLHYGHVGNDNA